MRETFIRGAMAALAVLLSACGNTGAPDEATASEKSEQPVTLAAPTVTPNWSVMIVIGSGPLATACTASVLSEHYLLTAAHCVSDRVAGDGITVWRATAPGFGAPIYAGPARYNIYPEYPTAYWEPHNDVALIRLTSSVGALPVGLTGRAKLYDEYGLPRWAFGQRTGFALAGWGRTNLPGSVDCGPLATAGVLRLGAGMLLNPASAGALLLESREFMSHPCKGDSGGAWLYPGDGQFLAFAVNSGWVWGPFGNTHQAAAIGPKRNWIYEASRYGEEYLSCSRTGVSSGMPFAECFERRRVPPPPPPPGTGCPGGYHCCVAGPVTCEQCVRDGQYCP